MAKKAAAKQQNEIARLPFSEALAKRSVTIKPLGEAEEITLTVGQVYQVLAKPTRNGNMPTAQEIVTFMELCRARSVNPWVGDAYLTGYDSKDGPQFSLITSVHVLHKRAERSEHYDGMEHGVIVIDKDGDMHEREGAFTLDGDKLVGAWAKCHRKDRKFPFVNRIKRSAYDKKRSRWNEDPEGMLCKCAKAGALREAFPNTNGGMYIAEEMDRGGVIDGRAIPSSPQPIDVDQPALPQPDQSRSQAIADAVASRSETSSTEPAQPSPLSKVLQEIEDCQTEDDLMTLSAELQGEKWSESDSKAINSAIDLRGNQLAQPVEAGQQTLLS